MVVLAPGHLPNVALFISHFIHPNTYVCIKQKVLISITKTWVVEFIPAILIVSMLGIKLKLKILQNNQKLLFQARFPFCVFSPLFLIKFCFNLTSFLSFSSHALFLSYDLSILTFSHYFLLHFWPSSYQCLRFLCILNTSP